jgi:hypothetical protein
VLRCLAASYADDAIWALVLVNELVFLVGGIGAKTTNKKARTPTENEAAKASQSNKHYDLPLTMYCCNTP